VSAKPPSEQGFERSIRRRRQKVPFKRLDNRSERRRRRPADDPRRVGANTLVSLKKRLGIARWQHHADADERGSMHGDRFGEGFDGHARSEHDRPKPPTRNVKPKANQPNFMGFVIGAGEQGDGRIVCGRNKPKIVRTQIANRIRCEMLLRDGQRAVGPRLPIRASSGETYWS